MVEKNEMYKQKGLLLSEKDKWERVKVQLLKEKKYIWVAFYCLFAVLVAVVFGVVLSKY